MKTTENSHIWSKFDAPKMIKLISKSFEQYSVSVLDYIQNYDFLYETKWSSSWTAMDKSKRSANNLKQLLIHQLTLLK